MLKEILNSSRKESSEIEFRVELMNRGNVDEVLGTCVVDMNRILEDGSDRDYTPYKDLKVRSNSSTSRSGSGSIGEIQISIRAFACLDRLIEVDHHL